MHPAVAGFVLKQSGSSILYQADEAGPVYKPGDAICFYEQSHKVACGKVSKTSGQKLIVKVSGRSKGFNFYQGQELDAKGRAGAGSGGAAGSGEVAESSSDHDIFDISAGGALLARPSSSRCSISNWLGAITSRSESRRFGFPLAPGVPPSLQWAVN